MLPDNSETARIVVLVLLCLILFFFGLGKRDMWDDDESQHSQTSKEMVQSGDWIWPRLNGEPFYDKPPLLNWFVALSFTVLGFTGFAARLPAAILGLATVLVTYRFGRRMIGPQAACLGAVVLVTSAEFVVLSQTVVHDIALLFFVNLALLALYRAYAEERRRTVYLVLAYISVGFAIVAKGPIGAVLPTGIMLVFLALRRDLGFIRKMMPVRGVLISVLIGVPWYVVMGIRDPEYLPYFLLNKNVGHFLSEESRHPLPFYYYLPVLLIIFFPWSLHLPLAVWRRLRRRSQLDPARLFLLVWLAFVFVFFSLATSKLPTYILPLFPAAALLVGDLWADLLQTTSPRLQRGLLLAQLGWIALVVWIIAQGWGQATSHKMYDPELHQAHLIAISTILIAGTAVTSVLLLIRRYRALFAATAGILVVLLFYLGFVMLPVADAYRSTKVIALRLDRELPPGENFAFYHEVEESALFYTDRRGTLLRTPAEVEEHLRNPGAVCIIAAGKTEELTSVAYRIVDQYGNKIVITAAD